MKKVFIVCVWVAPPADCRDRPGLPEVANDTGGIDFVLSPQDMARQMVRIARRER